MYTNLFYTKDRVIYNYVDKNYKNNNDNYVIIDKREIAFFEIYNGNYQKKDNIASAICILENGEQIDVTNFLNLFTLEGAILNFTTIMLPFWRNIISEFHKNLSSPIKRFEFIDIEGNMIFNETNFLLSIDDFSIDTNLHKE
tara:strand:- start:1996 stop:2421 length:426 start_codon:yes stop_codon:yes gene_type:complete